MNKDNLIGITGIGVSIPEHCLNQTDMVEFLNSTIINCPEQKRKVKNVFLSSGISHRHTVIPDFESYRDYLENDATPLPKTLCTKKRMEIYRLNALPLAIKAINACIDSLKMNERQTDKKTAKEINLNSITHLITVSCTGLYAPGLDIDIIQTMKLSNMTHRTGINFMGCYGVFSALKCAATICQADSNAKVLIVSVELCSIHAQNLSTVDNLISAAIFSDGAGALLVQKKSEHAKFIALSAFYCDLLPEGEKDMAWAIGNHGFDIVLSSYIPKLVQSGISSFLEKLLNRHLLSLANFRYFAIHPGGKKILEACQKALNLTRKDLEFSYKVLKEYGNMSSATIVFVLNEIWKKLSQDDQQEKILACAFGPGLTLESMLLTAYHR